MGLFNRLFSRDQQGVTRTAVAPRPSRGTIVNETWLSDPSNPWLRWEPPQNAIVGEERRQREIRSLSSPRGGRTLRLVNVVLEPEPDNPVDAGAVKASVAGKHVGYLRSALAAVAVFDPPGAIIVPGVMRDGGTDDDGERMSIGVHIWTGRRIGGGAPMLPMTVGHDCRWPPHDFEIAERLARGPR